MTVKGDPSQDGVYGIVTFNMLVYEGLSSYIPNKNNNNMKKLE